MRGTAVIAALLVLAAVPASAPAAIRAALDVEQGDYRAGASSGKVWRVAVRGEPLRALALATRLRPTFEVATLDALRAAPDTPVGSLALVVRRNAAVARLRLPVESGRCDGAPAAAGGDWRVDASRSSRTLGRACLPIALETNRGTMRLTFRLDLAGVASAGRVVSSLTLALHPETARGRLLAPNPAAATAVSSAATATACTAAGADPCAAAGTSATDRVREYVGGAAGLHLDRALPARATFGTTTLIRGRVVRLAPSPGEIIRLWMRDTRTGLLRPAVRASAATNASGAFVMRVRLARSARYVVTAERPAAAGPDPRLNRLLREARTEVRAPRPRLGTGAKRALPGGLVSVRVTMSAPGARGLQYIVRAGRRSVPGTLRRDRLSFVVRAAAGTRITIVLTAPGITPSIASVRV